MAEEPNKLDSKGSHPHQGRTAEGYTLEGRATPKARTEAGLKSNMYTQSIGSPGMTILPVETASVFEPLLAKGPRYYGAHGGRGLGKSWYFAGRLVTAVCFSLGLVAQPLAPVLAGESLQEKPTMTKHTIGVEHLRIESGKSFADVRAALERSVPQLDPTLVKALADGDVERANREKEEGPELSIFQVRDHGALLAIAGKARNALQYDIGNPVTASLMTRHQLASALYAPIRVVLYEDDAGHGVFEYDQPSTTFGQFGDEQVTAVAHGLDAALERALLGAAE